MVVSSGKTCSLLTYVSEVASTGDVMLHNMFPEVIIQLAYVKPNPTQ